MRSDMFMGFIAVSAILIMVVAIGIAIGGTVISISFPEEKTITVQEKLGAHGDEGQYLIIDTDANVYTVADNLLLGSFDASNRYAKLKADHKYHIKTFGIRLPLLSWYPNILEIEEVSSDDS